MFSCIFSITSNASAATVYQSPKDFIANNFRDETVAKTLWITGELAQKLQTVLGHKYHKLRLRYWIEKQQSAWVLEEIGKDKYITAGFVINEQRISKASVLIFRESRGWEIKFPFFTNQFIAATLTKRYQLSKHIDNITGATLSVDAVERMAKAALFLDQWVKQ